MSIEQKNGMTVQKVEDAKSLPVCFDVVLWPFIHFHFTKIKIDNETIYILYSYHLNFIFVEFFLMTGNNLIRFLSQLESIKTCSDFCVH